MSLNVSTARGNDCAPIIRDCTKALEACDAVVQEKQKVLDLYKLQAEAAETVIGEQAKKIGDLDRSLKAWYHDPLIVGLLGIIVGGVAVSVAHK